MCLARIGLVEKVKIQGDVRIQAEKVVIDFQKRRSLEKLPAALVLRVR